MQDAPDAATSAPPLGAVLETALYVADLDRSEAFYHRLFGFGTLLRDGRMCAMALPGEAVLLLFVRGGSEQPSSTPFGVIPGHGSNGRSHLCFKIAAAGLDPWCARLAAQDIPIESRITWLRGGTSLYFRDPDDHSIELASPGLWANY